MTFQHTSPETSERPAAALADPLASTRFIAPRLPAGLMPRATLVERLTQARRKRCVVLQGPPGCGKTSALLALRRALMTHGFEVAWLSLAADDNDLGTFLQGLLASVAQVDAAVVRNAWLLASGGQRDAQAAEHLAIVLAQDLARREGELVLMLDDAHQLADGAALQTLQWLLDYAPPSFHLVLASREAPRHPLGTAIARLRQLHAVADFLPEDLRFTATESAQFLRERVAGITHEEAMRLHERTDGWIAGLQLLSVHFQDQDDSAREMPLKDAGGFAAYFERNVLANMSAGELDLLTRASACPRFCADLCYVLLEARESAARIEQRLGALDRARFFIHHEQEPGQESWWRLHPLLREVLNGRLQALPGHEQRQLHRRAWRWFAGRGSMAEAVRHAVLADEGEAAAHMVESCARRLLSRGEFTQMSSLLARLPAGLVEQRIGLRFARAHVRLNWRELDALVADFAVLADEPLDVLQRAELDLLRCAAALHRDDVDLAARLLAGLDELPPGADALLESTRANLSAWVHLARGEFALAREVLGGRDARQGSAVASLTGLCLLGLSHTLEGRMVDAEHLYRQVLEAADGHGAGGVQVSNLAAALLGDVLYELDELEAACALLDARMDLIEHTGMPEAILRGAMSLASAHWLCGRRLEALAQLDRLEDYATRHGLGRLQAHALCLRVRLQQQRGQMLAVSDALCRLDELVGRQAQAQDSVSQEIRRLAEQAQIAVHLNRGEFEAAAQGLRRLLDRVRAAGRMRPAASLLAQLALVERALGHGEAAGPMLVEALRLAHRLGLLRIVLDTSRRVPGALHELVESRTLDPVLDHYARRLLAVAARQRALPSADAAAPARTAPAEPLKEREREILGLLAQALPNKKIARILGLSPETVKWHLKNIYAKLGVTARDAAVARARDLEL
ncbi:LuxR C-terminal-related transcriptional regulator [Verticiella sediminum]|nr:LuxR C-terminal-related transcriptional regulator [Verticiella sediminum]